MSFTTTLIGESQLNVYVIGADKLSPRLRERIQAQVQSALRAMPPWVFALLRQRLAALGTPNFPLIVEPQPAGQSSPKVLSVGSLGDKPAARLAPVVTGDEVDWRQERVVLVAKALAYLCAPGAQEDEAFWERWREAVERDGLTGLAREADPRWGDATVTDLLMEMFAAYVLTPRHQRWQQLPALRQFFDAWRAGVAD